MMTGRPALSAALEALARGEASWDVVAAVVEEARAAVQVAREHVEGSLAATPSHLHELLRPDLERVQSEANSYRALLQRTCEVAPAASAGDLYDLASDVEAHAAALNRAMEDYQTRALTEMGPTGLPGINLILNRLATGWRREDLTDLFEAEAARILGLPLLDDEAREAGDRLLELLEGVEADLPTRLEVATRDFERHLERTRVEMEAAVAGPTPLPLVNVALHGVEAWREGNLRTSSLQGRLETARDALLKLLEAAGAVDSSGEPIREAAARIVDGLDQVLAGLEAGSCPTPELLEELRASCSDLALQEPGQGG
ncbi:MAG: hypothetical protein AB1758_37495 [Candidatus Eremiobacterota bacterium]